MEEKQNTTPSPLDDDIVLDVKPLRTLTPLFRMPFGFNASMVPDNRPFVSLTPFNQYSPLDDDIVLDAKPLRTLTPMFRMPFGSNASMVPGNRPFVSLTPFNQYPPDTPLDKNNVMDANPFRTLTPIFPVSSGFNAFTVPGVRPFVWLPPFNEYPPDSIFHPPSSVFGQPSGFSSSFLNSSHAESHGSVNAEPIPNPADKEAADNMTNSLDNDKSSFSDSNSVSSRKSKRPRHLNSNNKEVINNASSDGRKTTEGKWQVIKEASTTGGGEQGEEASKLQSYNHLDGK